MSTHHVPQCHIHAVLECLQGQWLYPLPAQPVPMPHNFFWVAVFTDIQPDSRLLQKPTCVISQGKKVGAFSTLHVTIVHFTAAGGARPASFPELLALCSYSSMPQRLCCQLHIRYCLQRSLLAHAAPHSRLPNRPHAGSNGLTSCSGGI